MGNIPGFLNTNSKGVFVGAGYGDNEPRQRSNNGKKGGHNPRFELESDMDRACGNVIMQSKMQQMQLQNMQWQ